MSRFRKITSERYAGSTLSVPDIFKRLAREHSFRRDWYSDYRRPFDLGSNLLKPKERSGAA